MILNDAIGDAPLIARLIAHRCATYCAAYCAPPRRLLHAVAGAARGQVVAERMSARVASESLLGLHYPAFDVPQAGSAADDAAADDDYRIF